MPNLKPSTVSKFSSENGCGIKAIEAHNLGTENDSLPGDVYIGYFRTLPGADEIKGRNYFIVCNALTSGNGLHPEQQHGSSRETAQSITLTFGERWLNPLLLIQNTSFLKICGFNSTSMAVTC